MRTDGGRRTSIIEKGARRRLNQRIHKDSFSLLLLFIVGIHNVRSYIHHHGSPIIFESLSLTQQTFLRRRKRTHLIPSVSSSDVLVAFQRTKPSSSREFVVSPSLSSLHATTTTKASHPFKQQLGEFEILFENVDDKEELQKHRQVKLLNFIKEENFVDFNDGWDLQKQLMKNQLDHLVAQQQQQQQNKRKQKGDGEMTDDNNHETTTTAMLDTIIMLEHKPVYTLGTGSDPNFIKESDKIRIVRMDRGGEVTYHGPGQLVVYPIFDLRNYKQDIHWYMRALEESILLALKYAGIPNATREDNVTGVWISDKKVAAIGVKAKRWITMHGLAVNVLKESLENFDGIVPCGLEGRHVTCINDHLDEPISVGEFAVHLQRAMEEIFCITIVQDDE